MSGDSIARLPTNPNVTPSSQDLMLVNHLFGSLDKVDRSILGNYLKGPALAAGLAGLLMLPVMDSLVEKFIPACKNNLYVKIIVKMIIMAILYWAVTNWALSRK